MSPALRKASVTAHVASSLAWLGAVASFLVLGVAGLTSGRADTVRAAYLAMNLIGLFMIVPMSVLALLTGLVLSLGTSWGLVRHYWVLVKLALTSPAVAALLLHQFTAVSEAARRASGAAGNGLPDVGGLGTQLVADAGAAVLVLLVVTALGVYKPWGRTAYGRRKLDEERAASSRGQALRPLPRAAPDSASALAPGVPTGLRILLAVLAVIVAAFIVTHLAGGGLGMHGR